MQKREVKIVFLSEMNDVCLRKICDEIAMGLKVKNVTFYKVTSPVEFSLVDLSDFVVLNRLGTVSFTSAHQYVLQQMENPAKRFVYYIDDAIDYRFDNSPWLFMERASVILVPTEEMKRYLVGKNSDIEHKIKVLPTHICLKLLDKIPPLARIDDRFQILWAGTGLTGLPLISKIVKFLDENFPDTRLFCVGSSIGLVRAMLEPPKRIDIRYFETLPYESYASLCNACDIHINPLCKEMVNILIRDIPDPEAFIRVKAPIKFLHAGQARKILITTPIPSYLNVVEAGKDGFFARDDEWEDVLRFVIENYSNLSEVGRMAREKVERVFDTEKVAVEYLKVYLGDFYEEAVEME